MTKRIVLGFLLAGLVALSTAAATKTAKSSAVTCSLTGKTVEQCCCTQTREGKLYCTLAKKEISSCCCKPAATKKAKTE